MAQLSQQLDHPRGNLAVAALQMPSDRPAVPHRTPTWDRHTCPQCVTPVKGHHLSGEQSPTSSGNGSMPNVSLATERKVKDQSMTRRLGRAMVPANRSVSQGNLDMVKAKLL